MADDPGTSDAVRDAADAGGHRARSVLRAYARLRDAIGPEVGSGASFDILLAIFAANVAGDRMSVSAVGIAAVVPHASAVRWVRILEQQGLIRRVADPGDRRRFDLYLTPTAMIAVQAWLDDAFAAAAG